MVSINTGQNAYFGREYKVEELRLANVLTRRVGGIHGRSRQVLWTTGL